MLIQTFLFSKSLYNSYTLITNLRNICSQDVTLQILIYSSCHILLITLSGQINIVEKLLFKEGRLLLISIFENDKLTHKILYCGSITVFKNKCKILLLVLKICAQIRYLPIIIHHSFCVFSFIRNDRSFNVFK